ncbi:MAG: DUF4842 domain-containing protein [Muribaculaceae bacterium]|nr:DUF4842 domain-containing protein [Muribaculaceae bacterium]
MKKTLNLLMLLWLVALTACSADEPKTISATEDYNREFVREFGVPAAGHDFSMATTAGLKVSTLKGDHITVTAEIDGEEYLFADCYVPVGTTAIPVTIPRTVSQLKLATTRGERTVATNALVNLDEITTETSRLAAPQNADGNPYIAFKVSDLLKNFFEKNKSAYHYDYPTSRVWYNFMFERAQTGYLFPIYWRKDKDGYSDYKVQFSVSEYGKNISVKSADIIFDETTDPNRMFPGLRYSPVYDSVDDIPAMNLNSNFFCNNNSQQEAFPKDFDKLIISRGIRIEDYYDPTLTLSKNPWYIEVKYGFNEAGEYSMTSESPYRNVAFWNGNYYDMPLKYLPFANYGALEFSATPKEDVYIYDEMNEQCRQSGKFTKLVNRAFIIGFNTAPTSTAFADDRDYGDVVFLWVGDDYKSSATSTTTTRGYSWTIAAEDLGATDDWDFNDAVFKFTDQIKDLNTENYCSNYRLVECGPRDAQPVRVITVKPHAAGGTMPLYITYTGKVGKDIPKIPSGKSTSISKDESADIMYSDANNALKNLMTDDYFQEGTYIVGKEIHSWLGSDSYTTMINTGEKNQNIGAEGISFAIPVDTDLGLEAKIYDKDSQQYTTGSLLGSTKNKTLCGFAVLVDRNNTIGINELSMHRADNIIMGEGTYVIGKPDHENGEVAPQMILVAEFNWQWPRERVKISDAYPDFAAWLADPSVVWTSNKVNENVTY